MTPEVIQIEDCWPLTLVSITKSSATLHWIDSRGHLRINKVSRARLADLRAKAVQV